MAVSNSTMPARIIFRFRRRNAACLRCRRRAWHPAGICLRSSPFSTYSRVRMVDFENFDRGDAALPVFARQQALRNDVAKALAKRLRMAC